MRRRDLIILLGGAIAWPLAARAQQPLRVIGFLHQGAPEPLALMTAFRLGLGEAGITEGRDVTIEHRWADGQYDRLPALAEDLVHGHVAVIAANFLPAALAAKSATRTIPIVFLSGSDPIVAGLVSSFNRPAGNVTGIAFMFTRLGPKNLELLRELVPKTAAVAALMNPTNPNAAPQVYDLQAAARSLRVQLDVFGASSASEIDEAFATLAQHQLGALVITADGFLIGRQDQLVALAARYAVPTIYPLSQYVAAGGLMSYGASLPDAFRQTGLYVGKVLKGATPADLPVMQPTTFELVVNLKTAKALGLTVPPSILDLADEVIE
jgi:putative tryptophan/tyrosine transport system substrate-binding protein